MLFKARFLDGIRAGRIDRAFRFWTRPGIREGGILRSPVGLLRIDLVEVITPDQITEPDAVRAGFGSREALLRDLGDGKRRDLYRIAFHLEGEDPRLALRERDDLAADELMAVLQSLDRMDQRAAQPWTKAAMTLIATGEGRPAGEIAEALAMEKPKLKRRIAQLKELGLTESLQTGYRLSPRGRVVLDALDEKGR